MPRLPKPEDLRARKERHKQRGKVYRVVVGDVRVRRRRARVSRSSRCPGPGWLVVALGLAMLALEFDRAERLLEKILVRLDKLAEQASEASPLVKGLSIALTVVGLVGSIAVVVLFDVPYFPG